MVVFHREEHISLQALRYHEFFLNFKLAIRDHNPDNRFCNNTNDACYDV